jgi:5-methylcytosine-specific restriction endonuclease McrA
MRVAKPGVKLANIQSVRSPPKRADEFYLSPEWRDFRRQVFRERGRRCGDPFCAAPDAPGLRYLDHIKERKDGGADFDRANVMIRCPACNGRKTEAERARRTAEAARG